MRSRRILYKKNKRSCEVLSEMEGVYGRIWYLGKRGRLRKCKESSSRIWRKIEYRSKITREDRYGRRKEL